MSTDLQTNWPWIVDFFNKSIRSTRHYCFATTNPDGSAHLAPYASLVLKDNYTGYYSDAYPNHMARNLSRDRRVSILAVNTGKGYWLKSLFRGRCDQYPGIRLFGTVGESRNAGPGEVEQWRVRVRQFKRLKGYELLWKNIRTVRDIRFTGFEPVHLGAMTRHL